MSLAPTRSHRTKACWSILATAYALLFGAALAMAEDGYPNRTVHVVVPFAPGGAVDTIARLIGGHLQQQTQQTFIIDNKPGASGNLGADAVAKSKPDGYTLLVAANGLATNPTLFPQLRFDTLKDFEPISGIGFSPLVLVTYPTFPANSVSELIAMAKAKPDDLTYGSAGNGSSNHLATELFKMKAGIGLRHVAYRGGAPALIDLMAGRISLMLINPAEVSQHILGGQLKALAVTDQKRLTSLPNVPTLSEAGLEGFTASVWWCVVGPAGTPADVVTTLNSAIRAALDDPQVKEKLTALGVVTRPTTPAALREFLASEIQTWGEVIRAGNIKAD